MSFKINKDDAYGGDDDDDDDDDMLAMTNIIFGKFILSMKIYNDVFFFKYISIIRNHCSRNAIGASKSKV